MEFENISKHAVVQNPQPQLTKIESQKTRTRILYYNMHSDFQIKIIFSMLRNEA